MGLPSSLTHTSKGNVISVTYPLQSVDSVTHLSDSYQKFITNSKKVLEPTSYKQAVKDPLWCAAMQAELNALESNNTCRIVDLPPNKRVVGCKWLYKVKYKADGTLDRYKARLVTKGYTQTLGIDLFQTYALVAKMTTVRTLLSLAAVHKWTLHQLEINNAFLNGDLLEEIFMQISPGITIPANFTGSHPVYLLIKSLYGLRQAPREWFSKFSKVVLKYGFTQSKADSSLFILHTSKSFTALLVYVDDIILTGSLNDNIQAVKVFLQSQFKLKDLEHLHYFLGIEIAMSHKGIYLHQRKYALNLLTQTGLLASKPSKITIAAQHNLHNLSGTPLSDGTIYRRLVGQLI